MAKSEVDKKSKKTKAPSSAKDKAPSIRKETAAKAAITPAGSFPIVGVGASAGGLEAFTELLKALRPQLGMAFVLVPHLDPLHESAMTELLSRSTRMPVREVEQGMRVKPDHVYVIPPGREMTIRKGILQLEARQQRPPMPVDIFLRSLAEDRRNNAIGVILSGTATDGTLGLAAIKGEGGITFAQDPKTAKYDGMPSSAVASGAVDFVLKPAAIAEELAHIRSHPYILNGHDEKVGVLPAEGDHDMATVFRVLKQVTKVDFSDYKPATLRRRILRRMALKKISDFSKYVSYLREHREEAEALYQDILINVTSFFRGPETFEALKQAVYPVLLKDRTPGDLIRIWVPGCSTGEEAYSHAISLMEYLSDVRADVSIQIFATDLSESALQRARTGIYKENITADVSPARLRRFFHKVEGGYQISKVIRDLCVFARQNVFSDPPFSKMDIVSCRNLLIYLGPALQKRVIPVFHYALRHNGFLMLGNTEGLMVTGGDLFDLVDKKNKIYVKRPGPSPVHFGFAVDRYQVGIEAPVREPKDAEQVKAPLDAQKEADRMLLAKYVPAAVAVNEGLEILQTRGHTGKYLELPPGKASLNLMRMARPGLIFELQKLIERARTSGAPVVQEKVQLESNGELRLVNIEVVPYRVNSNSQLNFLIVFHDPNSGLGTAAVPVQEAPFSPETELLRDKHIETLKQEVSATKEYLQSVVEEREATNEELQSANEELQSTNEELQTSKEELESANEELNTVNEEMQHRNLQLAQVNNDLTNLLNSVNIPIVMLGPDLSVRRFTLHAEKLLGLSAPDVGRPISSIKMKIAIHGLEELLEDVIRDVIAKQQEFEHHGAWYNLRVTPYRTSDNKIDGVVLVLLDISNLRQSQRDLKQSQTDLRQSQTDLRQSQTDLRQSRTDLRQSQTQLRDSQQQRPGKNRK